MIPAHMSVNPAPVALTAPAVVLRYSVAVEDMAGLSVGAAPLPGVKEELPLPDVEGGVPRGSPTLVA